MPCGNDRAASSTAGGPGLGVTGYGLGLGVTGWVTWIWRHVRADRDCLRRSPLEDKFFPGQHLDSPSEYFHDRRVTFGQQPPRPTDFAPARHAHLSAPLVHQFLLGNHVVRPKEHATDLHSACGRVSESEIGELCRAPVRVRVRVRVSVRISVRVKVKVKSESCVEHLCTALLSSLRLLGMKAGGFRGRA